MGDLKDSNSIDDRVLSAVPLRQEDIKVVFHKIGDDDDEHTTQRINLKSNSHDERGNEEARTRTVESSAKQRLCPPLCCRIGGGGDPISTDAVDTVAKGSLHGKVRENVYHFAILRDLLTQPRVCCVLI